MKQTSLNASLWLLLFASPFALATPPGGKPPKEAIEACVDKAEGDSVTFETRRGDTLTGTCQTIKEQLVAVPDDHKHQER